MSNVSLYLKPIPYRIILSSVMALATLAAWMWALYVRQFLGRPPLSLDDLIHLEMQPYALGISVQALVIPLVLIYLFSHTSLFRRIVAGEAGSHDTLRLFGMLVLLQFLALNYDLWLFLATRDQTTFGLLIVVIGGLLGGWRVGVCLGLITAFISGTRLYVAETGARTLLLAIHRPEALLDILRWALWPEFFGFYLASLRVSMAIWAGVISSLCADLLGERRFMPLAALGLGAAIELGAGYSIALTVERPAEFLGLLIASTLVTGLALAIFALIVRGVQADVARRKAEATELALTRAELRALRAQINPHFFFNALNTIRYCVRTDPEAARRLLLDLSEIFQRALRSGELEPLRDEIRYAEAYLAIEKARLGERLRVAWSLPQDDSPLLDHPIPTLILQPIVENAVIHGIARKPEGGTVTITLERRGGDLVLRVEDDGVGIDPSRLAELLDPAGEGEKAIGLRNVDGRLRAFYGEAHRLKIESQPEHGTQVEIRIPVIRDD